MKRLVYLNGQFVASHRAAIPIDDHGFLYGDGVYETLRAYNGRPFHLGDHLDRLNASMRALRLAKPPSAPTLRKAILKTIELNGLSSAVVRVTVTRGPGPRGLDPRLCPIPTVLITAAPVPPIATALYETGITAVVATIRRNDPAATPPAVKSISCLNGVLAKMEANDRNASEALLLTRDGALAEGTVTNVFAVKNRTLSTPKLDGTLLAGVTRNAVLALARRAGYATRERRLEPRDLLSADEVFLTSTVMEIVPVTRILLQKPRVRPVRIGLGRPGPVAADLLARYRSAAGGR